MTCEGTWISDTRVDLWCHGAESTPLYDYAQCCGITYDLQISLWFYNSEERVEYLVQGSHDLFPNYEVYLGDQFVYGHSHGDRGIGWLLPPPEVQVFRAGNVQ